MQNKKSIIKIFLDIWKLLGRIRKLQILILFILSLFSGFFEVISIGAIIPFIDILLDPRSVSKYLDFISFLNLNSFYINNYSEYEIKLFVTIVFVASIIVAALFRLTLFYLNLKISLFTDFDLKRYVFDKISYSNLNFRKELNINETLSSFEKIKFIYKTLQVILLVFSYSIYSFIIVVSLFFLNYYILFLLSIWALLYFLIVNFISRKFILSESKKNAISIDKTYKILNSSFYHYKNIILDKLYKFFTKSFKSASFISAKSYINTKWIGALTSSIFVTLLFIFVTIIIFKLSTADNFSNNLSQIVAIAFGSQKLVTSLSNIFGNYQRILYFQAPLADVLQFIKKIENSKKEKITKRRKLYFKDFQQIELKKIKYKIKNRVLFKNLNVKIKSRDKVLITGKTGVGKTTLIEIISGLNNNFDGNIIFNKKKIKVNNFESIRDFFSIVPQNIFIFEDTISENVITRVPKEEEDINKLRLAIKCAELDEFVNNQKGKLNHVLSLDGQKMSGGQKQRIGIARALYKDTPIIIFDEATNALDKKTEIKIFHNIKKYYDEKTLICISHNNKIRHFFNKKVKI